MCLILFALNHHPEYKLILAANRDEFFDRPTLEADFWEENNRILGGRDLTSYGTWLGINANGRFIAITNYRDLKKERREAISRGEISKMFLSTEKCINSFISDISSDKDKYNGFNLLLSEDGFDNIYHYSNISDELTKVNSGIHGLSNHLLNTEWPKVKHGKAQLGKIVESKSIESVDIFEMLKHDREAPDQSLPNTGISYELEKKLSPVFISMKGYGTRSSTVLLVDHNNQVLFHEVSYDEKKQQIGTRSHKLYFRL